MEQAACIMDTQTTKSLLTHRPNATKPLVPPKPKNVPLPRSATTVNKTSTGTQVNLLRKRPPQAFAKPETISLVSAVNNEQPAGKVKGVPCADLLPKNNNTVLPEPSQSATIIRKEQKVYIHKTEVRKTSTVIVKPHIAPKPVLKNKPKPPPNVSFAPEDPSNKVVVERKGILKSASVTRSNSAPIRKSNAHYAIHPDKTYRSNSLKKSINGISLYEQIKNRRNLQLNRIPAPIVFTGWRRCRTFPVITNCQLLNVNLQSRPLTNNNNNNILLEKLKLNTQISKTNNSDLSKPKPLTEFNNRCSKKVVTIVDNTKERTDVPTPVPPPRLKRRQSFNVNSTPSNINPQISDSPFVVVSLPLKSTPIYAKINRTRKWSHRRNIRRLNKNNNSIYNNENIEKTSLLIDTKLNLDEEEEDVLAKPDPLPVNEKLMDKVKELNSCAMVNNSPKNRAQSSEEEIDSIQVLPRIIGTLPKNTKRDANPTDKLPHDMKTNPEPGLKLVDNKSFLFTIMSPEQNDGEANSEIIQPPEIPCIIETLASDQIPNNSTADLEGPVNADQDCKNIELTENELKHKSDEEERTVDETVSDGKQDPLLIADGEQDPVLKADKEQDPVLKADKEQDPVLKSNGKPDPLLIADEKQDPLLIDEATSQITTLDIINNKPTNPEDLADSKSDKGDSQSEDESETVVERNPESCSAGEADIVPEANGRSKSSLLDYVDMEIQKVQHLLADIAAGSGKFDKKNKPKSSLSLPIPDVPKSVLLRKSSAPNLSASLSEFASSKNEDAQLSRRSWANKSTSSVGSTTSTSSLSSASKTNPGATPQHKKTRRMSDFAQWFWVDDGETSTGAMGDNENSPLHSSNEEIGFVDSSSGRPLFRRRRTVADFFGKARKTSLASFANASMIFNKASRRKSRCPEVPKIEIIYADNTSSTESKDGKRLSFDEDDEEVDLIEMRKKTEAERHDQILAELSPSSKKPFYVVREILSSEQTFVEVLRLITIEFPKSLQRSAQRRKLKNVISEQDLDFILGGLPILKGVNEDLLQDLEERVCTWDEGSKIADIFVKKGAFLKHYTNYIKDFEKISRFFDTSCEKNSNFALAVREFEHRKICHNLGLKPYMLKPVQRMPQYSLLLEDYLRNLEPTHVDYEDTVKAITIVRSVAEHANETIRVQAAWEQLILLQKRIPGVDLLGDNARLVREGELMKVGRKELRPRFFVLMSDSLLCLNYISASTKDLKLKYKLPLTRMKVLVSPNQEHQFEFSIIGIARSFNVVAKSARERDEWIETLSHTINEFNARRPSFAYCLDNAKKQYQIGKQAPIWVQDSRVSMCQACATEFSMTFRRHHCRSCGKVVCRRCSANEAPLQFLDYEACRVCDNCYEVILNNFDENYEDQESRSYCQIRQKFKKFNVGVQPRRKSYKSKRTVKFPAKIDEDNNAVAKLSGHLQWKEKKVWRRNWFVLIDCVLYIFAASEDVAAIKTLPVLGYSVEAGGSDDDSDKELTFQLKHQGRSAVWFQAESAAIAEKWVSALLEATTLDPPST